MHLACYNPEFRSRSLRRKCFIVAILLVVFVVFLSLIYVWKESCSSSFPDLSEISTDEGRREAFIDYITTQVDLRNRRILEQRERLELLMASVVSVGAEDRRWLYDMADEYGVSLPDSLPAQDIFMLYYRVDIIPLSLVLAVSAYESNWGRAEYALRAHNLCGIRCSGDVCKSDLSSVAIPGKGEFLRKFDSMDCSLDAFFYEVNVDPSYESFRWLRFLARFLGKPPRGIPLLYGLLWAKPHMDEAYVSELRHIILKYAFE